LLKIAHVILVVVPFKEVHCLATPAPTPRRIRALKQISSQPLAFTIDDFCDESTCAGLQNNSEEARLHFATLVAGELFAGQWGKNDGLRLNLSKSSDANNNMPIDSDSIGGQCAEGLHVDTNNGSVFRSVTAILYLNDISEECGGATVFPLAGAKSDDPRLHASKRLLLDQIAHTRGSAYSAATTDGAMTPAREADAALIESVAGTSRTGTGLQIQPQTGRLLLFFSRMDDGEIDPWSWHGGGRLKEPVVHTVVEDDSDSDSSEKSPVIEKKILTLFKEVSYGATQDHPLAFEGTTIEEYLSPQVAEQRRGLQALAEAHAPFFEQ